MAAIIYLAGCNTQKRLRQAPFGQRCLESFADEPNRKASLDNRSRLVWALDCGAFTAYTKGKTIDLVKYVDYIKSQRCFDWYLALDVIDGGPKENVKNYEKMRNMGVEPSPVWHEGEPYELFEEYCQEVVRVTQVGQPRPVVAIGFQLPRAKSRIVPVLDTIFDLYNKMTHKPPLHGLACVEYGYYPFASVDSTSWLNSLTRLPGPWRHLEFPEMIEFWKAAMRAKWRKAKKAPKQTTLF